MAKITLSDLTSLTTNETSAISLINTNMSLIETAMENTLSRDGTTPNTMEADLDLNSNKITNLAAPTDGADAATKNYADAVGGTISAVDLGVAATDGNFLVGDGSEWVPESGSTARTSLGLGSMATQAASSVTITGGDIAGITDLAVADGGTGSSTASAARTALSAAAQSQTEMWAWLFETTSDQDYLVIPNILYAVTIDSITTITASGTVTVTGKINTTALGGSANTADTSEETQAHASANTMSIGDDFVLTMASSSSVDRLSVMVAVTRVLD